MLEEVLETLVRRATEADDGSDLAVARERLHERTGPFAPGEPWYEPRIRFFLDWYLCTWISADGSRPGERVAASERERAVADACAQAERSLFEVLEADGAFVRLGDRLGGGRFRIHQTPGPSADRLRAGDLFDGHLVVVDEQIWVMPGPIFHPPETHQPIAAILARACKGRPLDRVALLDGLARMQMRLERFTSMRARHVYRWDALADRDILSAGWAHKSAE